MTGEIGAFVEIPSKISYIVPSRSKIPLRGNGKAELWFGSSRLNLRLGGMTHHDSNAGGRTEHCSVHLNKQRLHYA